MSNSINKLVKTEYTQLLDRILHTNPQKKAAKLLEQAVGVKFPRIKPSETPADHIVECSLTKSIKYNKNCIQNIQMIRDNLLSAFMMSSEFGKIRKAENNRSFIEAVGNIINLVSEALSLARKLNNNAMGLLVAADYLRNPKDIDILDFSKVGPVAISHFSCNEATAMCLTWLCNSADSLMKNFSTNGEAVVGADVGGGAPPPTACGSLSNNLRDSMQKIYSSFQGAILELRNSAQLSSQVFRVLLYCNTHGKQMLRDYILSLKREEVNDIITEVQTLRRQLDEITILFEKLGMSLGDIWSRCTGTEFRFESLQAEGFGKFPASRSNTQGQSQTQAQNQDQDQDQCQDETKTKRASLIVGKQTSKSKSRRARVDADAIKDKKKDTKFLVKLTKVFGRRPQSQSFPEMPVSTGNGNKGKMSKPPMPVPAVAVAKKVVVSAPKMCKQKSYGHGVRVNTSPAASPIKIKEKEESANSARKSISVRKGCRLVKMKVSKAGAGGTGDHK